MLSVPEKSSFLSGDAKFCVSTCICNHRLSQIKKITSCVSLNLKPSTLNLIHHRLRRLSPIQSSIRSFPPLFGRGDGGEAKPSFPFVLLRIRPIHGVGIRIALLVIRQSEVRCRSYVHLPSLQLIGWNHHDHLESPVRLSLVTILSIYAHRAVPEVSHHFCHRPVILVQESSAPCPELRVPSVQIHIRTH